MRLAVESCLWLARCSVPGLGRRWHAVWAIGDTVRIDPVRSRAFEENPKLFPDGVGGDYKNSNLVWDGASRRVSLHAARNETVAFQIVIERTGAKLTNVKVALGELAGPDGSHIPAANVDLFREWYVDVETPSERNVSLGPGWYPDALLPCLRWSGNLYPHTYVMPFDLPDPLNYVGESRRARRCGWMFTCRTARRGAAGHYTAPITVVERPGQRAAHARAAGLGFRAARGEPPEAEHPHRHGNQYLRRGSGAEVLPVAAQAPLVDVSAWATRRR